MQPTISIIVPTYNGSRSLGRAVESVLAQAYASWELLIIDDGSTDDTREVASAYAAKDSRIRLLSNPVNMGIQKTLNRGLAEAKGRYIARIDDDDAWIDNGKLAVQHAYMEAHPDCVLVGTGAIVVDEQGRQLYRYLLPRSDKAIRSAMLSRNPFAHPAVLFLKQAALAAGGYGEDANVQHVEDYDLWLRMGALGSFANLPIYGVMLTARPGSLSATNRIEQFRKSIVLAKAYRTSYPRYAWARVQAGLRLALFRWFAVLPRALRVAFLRFYKG